MRNILTVDVEDWFQTNDFNIPVESWGAYRSRVAENTRRMLDLFDKYDVKGTFFILGCIALEHPDLVAEIDRRGHEIGSHGGWHRLVSLQSTEEFRRDLLFSKNVLEDIIRKPVTLYRAPSWSISETSLQALEVLCEEGFVCDSSIQPFRTPLSGISGAPSIPYYPIVDGKRLPILEYPPTILEIKKLRIPFSGGFYLRAAPYSLVSWALKELNRTRPGMIYIHPWEIDGEHPDLRAPSHRKFIHYHNLRTAPVKLEKLLQHFQFGTLGEAVARSAGETPALAII